MTFELKAAYLSFIEDETNNKFNVDKLPGGIKIALDLLVETDPLQYNISSESISDLSQSYAVNDDGIPLKIMRWLKPYYKLKSL